MITAKRWLIALLIAAGASYATGGMTADEAIAMFRESEIMLPLTDESHSGIVEMIEAFRTELGVSDDIDDTHESEIVALDIPADGLPIIRLLAQTYYVLGDVFLVGLPEARWAFLSGKHWGLKALRMNPGFQITEVENGFSTAVAVSEDLRALYWAAANWMRAAQFSPLEAVFAGIPEKTEAMLLRCIELDGAYANHGPFVSLGAFWGGLPRLPAGYYRKNLAKSQFYFCQAIDSAAHCTDAQCATCLSSPSSELPDPSFLHNHVLFAEFFLMEMGYLESARTILDDVISHPIGDLYPLYNASSKEKATRLLYEIARRD